MPAPELDDVIAAMRDGVRFQIGGGRIFPTYAIQDGALIVVISDDGYTEEQPCDDARLRAAIADAPEAFAFLVAWWKEHRVAAAPAQPSWPPTPGVPTSVADAEATLRAEAPGPPAFGDDEPWSFVSRWPDAVVAEMVWPAVSRLLEDDDAQVRERAVWFAKTWAVERARSLARLVEVATEHAELYRSAGQTGELALALADLSSPLPAERPRVAAVVLALLGDEPPRRGGATLLAQQVPRALIERAPKWDDGGMDQAAAREAATAMALYRPDELLDLLAVLRSRSEEQRAEIMAAVGTMVAIDAAARGAIVQSEGLTVPTRACPSIEDCRAALGLRD